MSEEQDPGEVIKVATEMMEADRARSEQADVREIAQELGVPGKYVDRALVEVERRKRLRTRSMLGAALVSLGLVGTFVGYRALHRPAPLTQVQPTLAGLTVAFDLRHGVGAANGAKEAAARGARVQFLESTVDDAALQGVDVVVLLEARKLTPGPELEAIARFVEAGHGLVIADLGWSWIHYDKRPLEELPANVLGKQLGFSFTADVLGVTQTFDPKDLDGLTSIARRTPWVPSGITVAHGRVLVRDEKLAPLVGVTDAGKGHVTVLGHAGMVIDDPALLAAAVRLAAGR